MSGVYWAWGHNGWGIYSVAQDGATPTFTPSHATPEGLLVPGFVDIHIHGAFGIDFMTASNAEMLSLCDRLAGVGYEALLPTTITASASAVLSALRNLPEHPMVKGFHLEGPFISPKHPGAQPPSAIAMAPGGSSDWDEVLDHPRLRQVTLAPEQPGGLDLVQRLTGRGVVASLGHTDATFDQASKAFESGADHATHTFNAMRPFHHREPGVIGWALQEDRAYTELIYDRIHVHRDVASLLLRCKPKDKVVAVSDSTMASGLAPGTKYEIWGLEVEVGDKTVRLASNGALAGSAVTLLDVFQNLAEDFGAETAVRLCCVNPRARLQMPPTARRLLHFDFQYQLQDVWEC